MECPICNQFDFEKVFVFTKPPKIETVYKVLKNIEYYRETLQCKNCRHYVAYQEMDMSSIYSGDYVDATYKDKEGVKKTFEKIINLPIEKSDNSGRVKNISAFADKYWGAHTGKTVLDVGSGLGVFPYLMKKNGWTVTALDPDARAIEHTIEATGVEGICSDFFDVMSDKKYDLVTFNKVLEHVKDPIAMLKKSSVNLLENGLVYVEVPDGEIAAMDGSEREEFTIDHLHIFSFLSLALLADKAGFFPVLMERLKEPSTKYTLRVFLKHK